MRAVPCQGGDDPHQNLGNPMQVQPMMKIMLTENTLSLLWTRLKDGSLRN